MERGRGGVAPSPPLQGMLLYRKLAAKAHDAHQSVACRRLLTVFILLVKHFLSTCNQEDALNEEIGRSISRAECRKTYIYASKFMLQAYSHFNPYSLPLLTLLK